MMKTRKKNYLLSLKYILPVAFLALIFTSVQAQQTFEAPEQEEARTDFDEQELQKFANAAGKVMVLQQETEQKMVAAIQEENMELEKFNEILRSQQTQETEADVSEEEMESFNNAAEKIIQIQNEVQLDMVQAIQEEGLEPQQYEQIMLAYQSNPEVKARVDALLHNSEGEEE